MNAAVSDSQFTAEQGLEHIEKWKNTENKKCLSTHNYHFAESQVISGNDVGRHKHC